MSKNNIVVNILPDEVLRKVKNRIDADLIHEEFHKVDNEKSIGTLIF